MLPFGLEHFMLFVAADAEPATVATASSRTSVDWNICFALSLVVARIQPRDAPVPDEGKTPNTATVPPDATRRPAGRLITAQARDPSGDCGHSADRPTPNPARQDFLGVVRPHRLAPSQLAPSRPARRMGTPSRHGDRDQAPKTFPLPQFPPRNSNPPTANRAPRLGVLASLRSGRTSLRRDPPTTPTPDGGQRRDPHHTERPPASPRRGSLASSRPVMTGPPGPRFERTSFGYTASDRLAAARARCPFELRPVAATIRNEVANNELRSRSPHDRDCMGSSFDRRVDHHRRNREGTRRATSANVQPCDHDKPATCSVVAPFRMGHNGFQNSRPLSTLTSRSSATSSRSTHCSRSPTSSASAMCSY